MLWEQFIRPSLKVMRTLVIRPLQGYGNTETLSYPDRHLGEEATLSPLTLLFTWQIGEWHKCSLALDKGKDKKTFLCQFRNEKHTRISDVSIAKTTSGLIRSLFTFFNMQIPIISVLGIHLGATSMIMVTTRGHIDIPVW